MIDEAKEKVETIELAGLLCGPGTRSAQTSNAQATLAKGAKLFEDTGLVFRGADKRYRAASAYRDGGSVVQ